MTAESASLAQVNSFVGDLPAKVETLCSKLSLVSNDDAKCFREIFMIQRGDYGEKILPICIPFYNEEKADLHRTLTSLRKRIREVLRKKSANMERVYVLLVGDGYDKCSKSLRSYLCEIFNIAVEQLKPDPSSAGRIVTYTGHDIYGYSKAFTLTLLMKRDNAGKANSQELFCKLFTTALGSRYMMLTDCGTMYKEFCMTFLLEYMDDHPGCVGVTGHQRVMTLDQQDTESNLHNNLFAYAQGFDYEASQSMFSTPFTIAGCLPVIPGPCGLFNFELLRESGALDDYFDLLRASVSWKTPDLIMGNLVLAEDRILCFMAVSCSNYEHYTSIEPRAVFFFEAETDPLKLFQQRRRWLNGTEAGYVITWQALKSRDGKIPRLETLEPTPEIDLESPDEVKAMEDPFSPGRKRTQSDFSDSIRTPKNYLKRFFLLIFVTLQLLVHLLMLVSVGIFTVALHFSLKQLFPVSNRSYDDALVLFYIGLNLAFVALHYQRSTVRLHKPTAYALMMMNALTSVAVLVSYMMYLRVALPNFSLQDPNIILVFTKLLPFFWFSGSLLLALSHGTSSMFLWIQYFCFYMLMLPTMVSTLPLYALCRTWELSWGNRPSDSKVSDVQSKLDEVHYFYDAQMAFENGNYQQALQLLSSAKRYVLNHDMGAEFTDRIETHMDHVKKAMELQDKSNIVVFIVLVCNVILALLLIELENVALVVSVMTSIVFFPIVVFQLAACLFWLYFFIGPRRFGCARLFATYGYQQLMTPRAE